MFVLNFIHVYLYNHMFLVVDSTKLMSWDVESINQQNMLQPAPCRVILCVCDKKKLCVLLICSFLLCSGLATIVLCLFSIIFV